MAQTTTQIGRMKVAHPDQRFDTLDGGTALHAALTSMFTSFSNHTSTRYFSVTLANGASTNIVHNFGMSLASLTVALYQNSTFVQTGSTATWTLAEVDTNTISITNNSGSSQTIQVNILGIELKAVIGDASNLWFSKCGASYNADSAYFNLGGKVGNLMFTTPSSVGRIYLSTGKWYGNGGSGVNWYNSLNSAAPADIVLLTGTSGTDNAILFRSSQSYASSVDSLISALPSLGAIRHDGQWTVGSTTPPLTTLIIVGDGTSNLNHIQIGNGSYASCISSLQSSSGLVIGANLRSNAKGSNSWLATTTGSGLCSSSIYLGILTAGNIFEVRATNGDASATPGAYGSYTRTHCSCTNVGVWNFGTRTTTDIHTWSGRFYIANTEDLDPTSSVGQLRIAGNGYSAYLGLGTTAFKILQNSPSRAIHIVSNSLGVSLAANGTSWGSLSDVRKKKSVSQLSYGISEIRQIETVRFRYTEEDDSAPTRVGFSAQNLLPIVPEAVNGSAETQYMVTPVDLLPVIVNAIKNLDTRLIEVEKK